MNLIHRHIFANVFVTCAAAVSLFGFVLMVGNAMKDILPYVISGQLEIDTTVRLMVLMVPFVTYYALPMGMLTGILLVLVSYFWCLGGLTESNSDWVFT